MALLSPDIGTGRYHRVMPSGRSQTGKQRSPKGLAQVTCDLRNLGITWLQDTPPSPPPALDRVLGSLGPTEQAAGRKALWGLRASTTPTRRELLPGPDSATLTHCTSWGTGSRALPPQPHSPCFSGCRQSGCRHQEDVGLKICRDLPKGWLPSDIT